MATKTKAKAHNQTPGPSRKAEVPALMAGLEHQASAAQDILSEWQNELGGFLEARLKANVQLGEELAKSRSVPEIVRLQQEWAVTAARNYADEASRFMEMCWQAASKSAATLSRR